MKIIFTWCFLRFMFVFCCKTMKVIETIKITWCLDVIPLNDADSCFSARWCHFSPFGIIKRIYCFLRFELCFKTEGGYIFSFLLWKTLRSIVTLFFSNFFQSSVSDGSFISFQLCLFIKGLILLFFVGIFLFLHDLTWLLQRIENFESRFILWHL